MTGEDVIQAARRYLGVRWKHQGRTEDGLDCVGLLIRAAAELGVEIADYTNYTREPDPAVLLQKLRDHADEIPIDTLRPGDIVLIAMYGRATHVGLITDLGLLHSAALYRKVVEHNLSSDWRDRIVRAFRWKVLA